MSQQSEIYSRPNEIKEARGGKRAESAEGGGEKMGGGGDREREKGKKQSFFLNDSFCLLF